jgi:Flp pilus assembly pilin Flp
MRPNDATGQSTTEYTALLGLVAAALVGAGATVNLHDLGTAVASTVRTGICIVAGDICRPSDAAAAGLEPCTVGDRTHGGGATISVAWLRIGENQRWTVATRSDGTVLVTRMRERTGGAAAGLGVEASPLGLHFGVDGAVDFAVTSGAAWEFPDAAAAARFLAAEDRDRVPPTWRFGDAGEILTAEAGAGVGGTTLTGAEATGRWASGVRVGRGRTTLYIRTRLDTGATVWIPGRNAQIRGPRPGP